MLFFFFTKQTRYITEEQVERLLPKVFAAVENEKIPGTFFEMTTALSFLYYQEMNADAVVLETGLGGRLDSTNICHPSVTVVTSISKDHTKILGSNEIDIAREKGGIFKHGVPVVLGELFFKSFKSFVFWTTVPSKFFMTVKSYILVHGLFFSLLFSFIKKTQVPCGIRWFWTRFKRLPMR